MEKIKNYEDVMVKIKLLINRYYENLGRFGVTNSDEQGALIDEIDEILNNARLDKRKLILNKLEQENE